MQLITEMIVDSHLTEGRKLRHTLAQKVVHLGLPVDVVFDLQLAVSEAFNNAAEHGFKHVSANKVIIRLYYYETFLSVEVEDSGCGIHEHLTIDNSNSPRGGRTFDLSCHFGTKERGMGLALMRILMDEVCVRARHNGGTHVTFIKYLN